MKNYTYIEPHIYHGKRLFDLVFSLVFIITTWPLFILISLLVKCSSNGPVIYCQQRVGRVIKGKAKVFMMYKFRTMHHNAEKETGAVWASSNDQRLTVLGKFLRKTRLDELPQLLNVVKGDMSIIGPRPERPEIVENLEKQIPYYSERMYGVLPGITGLAQINQGYDCSIDDVKSKILYDFAYSLSLTTLKEWLKMDLVIIFRTILIMILGRGQ